MIASQQIRIVTSLPGEKSASCVVTGTVAGSCELTFCLPDAGLA